MKSHKKKVYDGFSGMNASYDPDRIDDDQLAVLLNAYCDKTGKIEKARGFYPVALGDDFGITTANQPAKLHTLSRQRGKNGDSRSVAILGASMFRSTINSIADPWGEVTWPTNIATPALNLPAAFVFRNRYCYHQNGTDIPFRVKMEEDDGSTASLAAEVIGLRPPAYGLKFSSEVAAPPSRFFAGATGAELTWTNYCVTFVYGDRGESGPSPWFAYSPSSGGTSKSSVLFSGIPIGPDGCTARRIYRTQIGRGVANSGGSSVVAVKGLFDLPVGREFFFLSEIKDNTTTTFTDAKDDSAMDFTRRVPPPRPFPPRSKYQRIHLDRIFWANLRDHPWTLGVMADRTRAGFTDYRVTISNTGNGTITFEKNNAGWSTDFTVASYKTKSLATILAEMLTTFSNAIAAGYTTAGVAAMPADGVDLDRTYVFHEVSQVSIYAPENVFWMEAIDGDAVVTDGAEKHPSRVMFSDLAFVEEINIFNSFDVNKDDSYPITGLFGDDYTLAVPTQNDIWAITGSFIPDQLFVPQFSVSRSRSEHGSFCTRPDAVAITPVGAFFVAQDGLRIFRGGASERAGLPIDKLLMERLLIEPRTRDHVSLHYESGILRIAYPGNVVA